MKPVGDHEQAVRATVAAGPGHEVDHLHARIPRGTRKFDRVGANSQSRPHSAAEVVAQG
ncbi:hypothetical protein [Streptomyces malaysiensis]|uniref:hypothetical protein n=1 Tax=Streptomyces malaysiensis TaxID=92644 RepID=UPI00371FA9C1